MAKFQIFQTSKERLKSGAQGSFPQNLIELEKDKSEIKHPINEPLTRPWLKHFFLTQPLNDSNSDEVKINRNNNLIEIFKTTIPLQENSFNESLLSSWRQFLDVVLKDSDTPWYNGIRKILQTDRFYTAIEQLELDPPASNPQLKIQFYDHTKSLRKFPRIPIKLFFSLPGNEKETMIEILRLAVNNNPHNLDIAFLTYCFLRAWDRSADFIEIARTENRNELEEWYFWVENDLNSVGALKRNIKDFTTAFLIYDRAMLSAQEYKELAGWFLKESEFKAAYHFYTKSKEFEIALELLQNISVKEYGELTNLRRISRGEKTFDLTGDTSRFASMYQEEMETLRGFARIRAAETYKQIATKARQHFDRETIETKYAFGELTEDEYTRLIRQIQERKQ
ncbi:MAG: hypothetical protein HY964_01045 [Ignavibacteriales bacterium]|nr:hypothetical protein [Ignavibacteriales bacterium]